ncbi:hypothetical protein [Massilia arenae]|uniref:Uncharacterized protein n=1 Tax=Massilia arenae TaxID=2603288 RepID=A0A5C7G7W7_9BURK|nr:hypothetical protein [Massilia arenae]TXG02173.1 hypothetical protein FVD38_00075 [Massilia arenae]
MHSSLTPYLFLVGRAPRPSNACSAPAWRRVGHTCRAGARCSDKGVEKAAKAVQEYEALLDRINGKTVGIDPSFYADRDKLYAGYKAGKQSLSECVATVETYIGQQPFAKQAEQDRLRAAVRILSPRPMDSPKRSAEKLAVSLAPRVYTGQSAPGSPSAACAWADAVIAAGKPA